MTKEELLNNGYREFTPPAFMTSADKGFQKKFSDEKGIKFYISFYCFESSEHKPYDSFEIDLQMNKQVKNMRIYHNITLFSFAEYDQSTETMDYSKVSLKDLEEYVEEFWKVNGFNYYETW